ncbi:MarR family winged helix-turn-helix transcriptional regulator [Paeniglutamicibacter cryotolerans]|uniref:DNA-binding MarR family transcriptional regulator n=1 Tax=Paeniglutamicibacter cryotolerans TaxID=670079 RepID=A0A839QQG3_9MICC|nr:MarR family transcriptional regulator [Paeniglutamicibacter cryotolerans]MBB2994321.1 DNA-binding MarR family transcriptional regulator [Paeniglutamicibacter cryotolerans]
MQSPDPELEAEQPRPDGPDGGLAAELRVAIMRTSRRLRVEASGNMLTAGQYSVLVALRKQGHSLGELAARERVTAPSMTRIVNSLETGGLLKRRPHPTDGRQVIIEATARGLEVLALARSERTAWLARRIEELDPADRAVLARAAALLQELSAR